MRHPSVAFLTQYDENGASTRIRICQFLPYFKEAGFDVALMPLISRDGQTLMNRLAVEKGTLPFIGLALGILRHFFKRYRDVVKAWHYDVVVVQKDVLPFGLLPLLKFGQKNIVFEFDDAIWAGHKSTGSQSILAKLMIGYRRWSLNQILKSSRATIVDNEYLARYARQYCDDVHIIAAPIDTQRYRVNRRLASPPTLGWIGSPGTSYLLASILPALEKLGQERPFVLVNIGGMPLASNKIPVQNIPWSIKNELKWLERMDVGLMPLDDTEFNRGKLGYKIVQYFSAGIPVLAAGVGLNPDYVKDGVHGYCYRNDDVPDFVAKAKAILDHSDLAQTMGETNRRFAEVEFDSKVLAQRFIEIVKRFVPSPSVADSSLAVARRIKQ